MTQAPNIVLIMADQLAPHFTGTYGHPLVQTPHMDALAAQGMRFDGAYCNSPLCAPSRASFMTGQQISRIGTYDNAAEFPASIPTFAHYLRQMGYHTSLSGKMHFVGPDQLHGFDQRLTTDIYPSDYAWTPDWEFPDDRIDKWHHNMDSVTEAGPAATTFQIEYDEETAFLARRRIFEHAMNPIGPFAMVVSLIHPHDPYVPRPEFWDLYDHASIDLPQTGPADDPHTLRLRHGIEADVVVPSEDEIRNARRGYYANTSYFDSKVGEVVKALKEAGLYNDTIVIVTSDHGDMLGERGLWYKMGFFEHSARVALIMAGPGISQGSCDAPVSLVDLAPTFLDIASVGGRAIPELGMPMTGKSLMALAVGVEDESRVVHAEYCAECTSHPIFMIRRGDFKYIECAADPVQLYDLYSDPFERENLAEDPAHAVRLDSFRAEAAELWEGEAIYGAVLSSQRQRRAVHAGMQAGTRVDWDYTPPRDASQEFVRNHMDWTEAASKMRFPPQAGVKVRS